MWDWQAIKEKASQVYQKASAFFTFQTLIGYLVACVAAGHPVTFNQYASFLNHLLNGWKGR